MPTDVLGGVRYPDLTYSPNVPGDLQKLVQDIIVQACPRFATTAARDSAYSAYTAQGGTLANGRSCWTDDVADYWDRIGGAWVQRVASSRSYANGTNGTIPLVGGWSNFSTYRAASYHVSNSGWVTLSGAVLRTAATFALGVGSPVVFGTLPSSIIPSTTVSPLSYAGLGTTSAATYPVRIYVPGNNALSVVGMDSGSGSIAQNIGFIVLDGAGWQL